MNSSMRRIERLEGVLGLFAEEDAADGQAAKETLITRLDALVERLAEPDAAPRSPMERIAWLASRDGKAAAEQLHTLIQERYGNART